MTGVQTCALPIYPREQRAEVLARRAIGELHLAGEDLAQHGDTVVQALLGPVVVGEARLTTTTAGLPLNG